MALWAFGVAVGVAVVAGFLGVWCLWEARKWTAELTQLERKDQQEEMVVADFLGGSLKSHFERVPLQSAQHSFCTTQDTG